MHCGNVPVKIMPIVSCFLRLTGLFLFIMVEVTIQPQLKNVQLAAQWAPTMGVLLSLNSMRNSAFSESRSKRKSLCPPLS